MKTFIPMVLLIVVCSLVPRQLSAQAVRDGRLLITVVDQTNAVIPGATVTVTGIEAATQQIALAPVTTSANGQAAISGVTLGRYSIRAEYTGFEAGVLKEVRVRPGDNRHVLVLLIERLKETLNVGQGAQAGSADRREVTFGTTLTREQLDALSDDPNELQRQLQDMAGPGAVIRIDSFEGGQLPPRAMIRAIHITRDQFAAENHGAEGTFIDIITQPGVGPIRSQINYNMNHRALSARNALAAAKGNTQTQNYNFNLGGGLIQNRASFSLSFGGMSMFETPVLTAARGTQKTAELLNARMPRDSMFTRANFDYAVTRDQTLRFAYNQNDATNRNLGIGGFNEIERAYTNENHQHTLRIQEAGPLGRRSFTNTRLNIGWTDTDSRSAREARTIRVLDVFTSGGAQVAGGRHSRDVNLASDLDYVRGIHSVRAGTILNAQWYRSDDTSNYLGTYTFESPDTYAAGMPRSYTQRVGDPKIRYFNLEAGFYVQDDVRIRRNLTLTPGLRYETQTHLTDRNDFGPRFGVTWAPFRSGKLSLRSSWGIFYDWLTTNTYEQTLRVDGFRQREINVIDPSFPDPGGDITASVTPVNRYLLSPRLESPRNSRVSAGVEYNFTQRLRASATYRYIRGTNVFRGLNLNAPVGGVRPDPAFANVVEVISDGASRQQVLQLNAQTPPPPPAFAGRLWDWKRFGFFSVYTLAQLKNNAEDPFTPPATGNLADDWGPVSGSMRHRIGAGFTSSWLRGYNWQLDGQFGSGLPYNIQTGKDENGDLIFNDREPGVGRNSARADPTWWFNFFTGYSFTFGPRLVLPAGPMIYGTPAGLSVTTVAPPPQGRYRISLNVFIYNLTNHKNYAGYSGVRTSPLFGQPTIGLQPRRVNVGIGLAF